MQNHVFIFNTHLSCFFLIWCHYASFVIMEHDALCHLGTHLTEVFFPVNISLWDVRRLVSCSMMTNGWCLWVDTGGGELLRCRDFVLHEIRRKIKCLLSSCVSALTNVWHFQRPTYIEILCVCVYTFVWISAPMVFAAIPVCIYLCVIVSVYAVRRPYTNLTCFSANTHTHTQPTSYHPPPLVTDIHPLIGHRWSKA